MDNNATELIGVIKNHKEILRKLYSRINENYSVDSTCEEWNWQRGLIAAGLFENYYTCAETIFLRIAQFFENNLDADRWHSHLLEKMSIKIEGTRPAVLSLKTANSFQELRRFRHFKRYYFELDYDKNKILFIYKLITELHHLFTGELDIFLNLLQKV